MILFPGTKYVFLAVFTADILCFLVGTSSSWTSPILPKLQNNDTSDSPLQKPITQNQASWIGSLLSMGGIFSPLIFGFFVQKIGRKTGALIAVIPFLVAYLAAAFGETVWIFYFSRVLMGIGTGGMFCCTPVYIVEIAEDANRGLLSASTGVFLVGGIFFSYVIGPYVSIMAFNLILSAVCLTYALAFWFLAPETPYHFVKSKNEDKALKSLQYLRRRSSGNLRLELNKIKTYLSSMSDGTYVDLFKTRLNRKAFVYSALITTFQQFSGINVIFTYMQSIFESAGSSISSEISSIVVGFVQLLFSFISPLLSDKLGRKTLMLISISGATISLTVFGVYFYLKDNNFDVSGIGWLPLLSLVVFMMFYNCGMGSLPWAIMSEILPSNIISKAYLLVTSIYWVVGWIFAQYFADLVDAVGSSGSFWLFAGLCVLYGLFIFVFIFETKGKSFQEIKDILSK